MKSFFHRHTKILALASLIGLSGAGLLLAQTIAHAQSAFDYALSNSADEEGEVWVAQGGPAALTTITATLIGGPPQPVTFSASGLPLGAIATFSRPSCVPTCSTDFTITTTNSTPFGDYVVTVTGRPFGKTTSFTLIVAKGVCSAEDLSEINMDLSIKYLQICDIDLIDTPWTPIGRIESVTSAFQGTYNGGGKAIANLSVDVAASAGLFAILEGKIKYVSLVNANVEGQTDVGTLVAVNAPSGIVQSSFATGRVHGGNASSIGGLVGSNLGLIKGSHADVTATNKRTAEDAPEITYVGGLVGKNSGAIRNSYANGAVSGNNAKLVGGLAGINTSISPRIAVIDVSYATGAVSNVNTGYTAFAAGGLVGASNGSLDTMAEVKNSYATGAVQSTSTFFVGGLVGVTQASRIERSYATGAVKGGTAAGGLIGMVESSGFPQATIENVDARGNVSVENGYAGGLIGLLISNASLTNGYATGKVSLSRNVGFKGGLIGFRGSTRSAPVTSSYWDVTASGTKTSAGGTRRTTAQMKTQKNYRGWDFTNVWSIQEGVGYPIFR